MSSTRRRVYLACFVLHFAAVGIVCLSETAWIFAKDPLATPEAVANLQIKDVSQGPPWQKWITKVVQVAFATYTNISGIEVGYGYFAPNIPAAHALVLECLYQDGRVEYHTPWVQGDEARLRLTTLIEQIGQTDFAPSRAELIKRLAHSTWQRQRDAVGVRAFFGSITMPTLAEFQAGKRERTFDCLYAYEFSRDPSKAVQSTR